MHNKSIIFKPAARFIDVLVMALAAYFALNSGFSRASHSRTEINEISRALSISENSIVSEISIYFSVS